MRIQKRKLILRCHINRGEARRIPIKMGLRQWEEVVCCVILFFYTLFIKFVSFVRNEMYLRLFFLILFIIFVSFSVRVYLVFYPLFFSISKLISFSFLLYCLYSLLRKALVLKPWRSSYTYTLTSMTIDER